jgi:hypothetical protein
MMLAKFDQQLGDKSTGSLTPLAATLAQREHTHESLFPVLCFSPLNLTI